MLGLLPVALAFAAQAGVAPTPAQAAPAAKAEPTQDSEPVDGGEIVVSAVYGHTTMLFDKGSDGKLRNCRIMVSSGSQKRDTAACQATPVCYAGTADEVTDCVPLTSAELVLPPAPPASGVQKFTMPQLVKPAEPVKVDVGPNATAGESKLSEQQSVKLPPLPKAPSGTPTIRLSNGQD